MDSWSSNYVRYMNTVLQLSALPVTNTAALGFVITEPSQCKAQLPTAWAAQWQAQVAPLFNSFATWSLMKNTSQNPTKLPGAEIWKQFHMTEPCKYTAKLEGPLYLTAP